MSENRIPRGFLGKLPVFEVKLVGGPYDGTSSLCSHDTVYKGGELYRRGPDDRYYHESKAGGKN